MSSPPLQPGQVGWIDLTVDDADERRDFYQDVVGWSSQPLAMEDGAWHDHVMTDEGGNARAGVCHARGPNAGLPPVWLPYFVVDDLDARLRAATERGAELLSGPRGTPACAILRDPGGTGFALVEMPPAD
jgi:predicted enzyme related to lactoylglutathione lyase